MSRNTIRLFFVLSLILLSTSFSSTAQTTNPNILVIYNTAIDKSSIESVLVPFSNVTVVTKQVASVVPADFDTADIVLFASSLEISWGDTVDAAFATFLSNNRKAAMVISPHLSQFEDDVDTYIKLVSEEYSFTENNSQIWDISLTKDVVGYNTSDEFQVTGSMALVTVDPSADVFAVVTNGTVDEENISYPYPVMWNATAQGASIIAGSFAMDSTAQEIDLEPDNLLTNAFNPDQLPDFVTILVKQFMSSVVQSQINIINQFPDTNNTNQQHQGNNFGLSTPDLRWLLAGLLAIVFLFIAKIVGIFEWIVRKTYGLIFFAFGAFHNIQDRSLSNSEVMMNNSRIAIIDYLDHMNKYGAHLREIKSVTKLGSGAMLWHLQVLEDYYLIEKYEFGGHTVFVSTDFIDQFDPILKEIDLKLQSKYTSSLLEFFIHKSPGVAIDIAEIEDATDIPRSSIRRLLAKFEKFQLIDIEKSPSIIVEIIDINSLQYLYDNYLLRTNYEYNDETANVSVIDN